MVARREVACVLWGHGQDIWSNLPICHNVYNMPCKKWENFNHIPFNPLPVWSHTMTTRLDRWRWLWMYGRKTFFTYSSKVFGIPDIRYMNQYEPVWTNMNQCSPIKDGNFNFWSTGLWLTSAFNATPYIWLRKLPFMLWEMGGKLDFHV